MFRNFLRKGTSIRGFSLSLTCVLHGTVVFDDKTQKNQERAHIEMCFLVEREKIMINYLVELLISLLHGSLPKRVFIQVVLFYPPFFTNNLS